MTNPVVYALTQNDPSDRPPPPKGCTWSAINKAASAQYPNGCITYHFDKPPADATQPPPQPDWQKFRLAMVDDTGYNAIANAHPGHAARVENAISFDVPNLEMVKKMWNRLIADIPLLATYKPKAADVQRWTAIATSANAPITYNPDGTMK